MRGRALACALGMVCGVSLAVPNQSAIAAAGPQVCVITGSGGSFVGSQGVVIDGKCRPVRPAPGGHGGGGAATRTVVCGIPGAAGHQWDYGTCGTPVTCRQSTPGGAGSRLVDAFATFVLRHHAWTRLDVWCPSAPAPGPGPSLAAIRQHARRLLPPAPIGAAWAGAALVNTQTILWADTPATRALPTATITGQPVHLRLRLAHAAWDYGDGHTHTATTPGRPYQPDTRPCATAACPGYAGHTYTTPGVATITLTISWHAQYRTPDTGWTTITPDPLTGPAITHTLTIDQTHPILVTPPSH